MSYHQDGLLDIVVGIYILGFGLGILMDTAWDFSFGTIMPGMLLVLILPIWIAAKRKITMPRIGYVNFGIRGSNKIFVILTGLTVMGLGAFFVFTLYQGIHSPWMQTLLQNGLLLIAIASLTISALFAYTMGLKRLYAYGTLALTILVAGHFMGIFFAYLIIPIGTTITITGSALLIKFIKKYPPQGEQPIAQQQ